MGRTKNTFRSVFQLARQHEKPIFFRMSSRGKDERRPDEGGVEGRIASKYVDPCKKAAALSMKCLEENSYDRAKCTYAFNNYRECKKQWIAQRKSAQNTQ